MKKPKPYEQRKTVFLHLRIKPETNKLLDEISEKISIDKSNLARMLLVSSLKKLHDDGIKSNWDLQFTIIQD